MSCVEWYYSSESHYPQTRLCTCFEPSLGNTLILGDREREPCREWRVLTLRLWTDFLEKISNLRRHTSCNPFRTSSKRCWVSTSLLTSSRTASMYGLVNLTRFTLFHGNLSLDNNLTNCVENRPDRKYWLWKAIAVRSTATLQRRQQRLQCSHARDRESSFEKLETLSSF